MSECPNCGGDKCKVRVLHYGKYGDYCDECGHIQWSNGESLTPRRSQPVEPLELPDADISRDWWMLRDDCEPALVAVKRSLAGPTVFVMTGHPCPRGQYVRCEPPIVKPKPKWADAEWLRQLCKERDAVDVTERCTSTTARLRRIADELERLRAKERE